MGNQVSNQENDFKVDDDELSNMITELIKEKDRYSKKNKKPYKKINNEIDNNIDNIDNNIDSNINFNIDNAEEMDTDLDFKKITDFIDLIYTKNINMQLKHKGNRSAYDTVFDLRNFMDCKEDLNNNEYNLKSLEIMNDIIEPKTSSEIKKEPYQTILKNSINNKSSKQININTDKDNIEDYYIPNDYFRKWDYQDDIFKNDVSEDFSDENSKDEEKYKEKEDKKRNKKQDRKKVKKEDGKKDIKEDKKENKKEDEKKDIKEKKKDKNQTYIEEISLNESNKDSNLQEINNSNINQRNNNFPSNKIYKKKNNSFYMKMNNNKSKNNKNNKLPIENSEEKVIISNEKINKNVKLNESQAIINNKSINKYNEDSDSSKSIEVGNTTKKNIYESSSSSDEIHPKKNNIKRKKLNESEDEDVNINFKYKKDKNNNVNKSNFIKVNNNINKLNINRENKKPILYRKNTPDSYINKNINNSKSNIYDKRKQLYIKKHKIYDNKNNDIIFNKSKENITYKTNIIYDNKNNINEYYNDLSYDNRFLNDNYNKYYNNYNNYYNNNNFNDYNTNFINDISKISKNEESYEYNIDDDYSRDNYPKRTKTPIINRMGSNKKEMIDRGTITDEYEYDIKKYKKLCPDKTSNLFYQKNISKTPDKPLKNNLKIIKEPRNFISKKNDKTNIDIKELNNIYNAIKKVDYQLSLIEKDKKQKNLNNNIYNYNNNKNIDNFMNKKIVNNKNKIYKGERAVTPINKNIISKKNRNKSNKKNVSVQKTFGNSNIKGYKDILIEKFEYVKNRDKEKNKQNYKYSYRGMNKAKTPNNNLRRKAAKTNNSNNIVSYKTKRNNIGINKYNYSKEKEPISIVNYVNLPTGNYNKRPEWK